MKDDKLQTPMERALKMAFLPGMQYMIDQMQAVLDRMTAEISGSPMTSADMLRRRQSTSLKKDGTPDMRSVNSGKRSAANEARARGARNGWPADPKERSAEMIRRRKVTLAKRLKAELPERMSVAGLQRGSRAYKDAVAHNKRVERAVARANNPNRTDDEVYERRAEIGRRRWDNKSAAARKKWQLAMQAGRAKATEARLLNGAA